MSGSGRPAAAHAIGGRLFLPNDVDATSLPAAAGLLVALLVLFARPIALAHVPT